VDSWKGYVGEKPEPPDDYRESLGNIGRAFAPRRAYGVQAAWRWLSSASQRVRSRRAGIAGRGLRCGSARNRRRWPAPSRPPRPAPLRETERGEDEQDHCVGDERHRHPCDGRQMTSFGNSFEGSSSEGGANLLGSLEGRGSALRPSFAHSAELPHSAPTAPRHVRGGLARLSHPQFSLRRIRLGREGPRQSEIVLL